MKSHKSKHTENQYLKKILTEQLNKQIQSFGLNYINQLIKQQQAFRQQKSFVILTSQGKKQYLNFLWNNYYQKKQQAHNQTNQFEYKNIDEKNKTAQFSQQNPQDQIQVIPVILDINSIILKTVKQRQSNVVNNIQQGELLIQTRQSLIKRHRQFLEQEKSNLQNQLNHLNQNINQIQLSQKDKKIKLSESRIQKLSQSRGQNAISQQNYMEFIKLDKAQKQKRKKLKQLQMQKQLENEKKKLQQQKVIQQNQQKLKLQQKRKRQKQLFQKRSKQKQTRTKHQSSYLQQITKIFRKQQNPQLPNVQDMLQRYQSQQLKKIKEQKQKLYKSYQKNLIDQHEKSYRQARQKIIQQRKNRHQEIKIIQKAENQKSRIKFNSSFAFSMPHQQYQKRKKQQYEIAKQKRLRILSYKDKVKKDFLPEIDENKKKQMLSLLQQIQLKKKGPVKKKILDNGQVVVQKVDIKDTKDIGLNYLQNVKQMVQKMRKHKKQNSQFDQGVSQQQIKQQSKKPKDYLKQMRQKGNKSTGQSFLSPHTSVFFKTKSSSMSLEQKLKKIQDISTKLMQKTRQQQMMLKYGKFKTSQEILNKKQIIDKNYLNLVNMKLQIIENDQGEFDY